MTWSKAGTILGVLIAAVSAFFAIDSHYAKAADVKVVQQRLELKIQEDRLDRLQERIWKLEDRYQDFSKAPAPVKEEKRKLDADKVQVNDRIQMLIKETSK